MRSRGVIAAAALLGLGGCRSLPYDPIVVVPAAGLPADAFARCQSLLRARYAGLDEADAADFRLRTDWTPGPDPDVPSQQRASLFRHGGGIGVVVEARYLRQRWFDSVPGWSTPRPDHDEEWALADALQRSLDAR